MSYLKNKQNNNKSSLDKIKESIYNYFKESENYDETVEKNKEIYSRKNTRLDNVGRRLEKENDYENVEEFVEKNKTNNKENFNQDRELVDARYSILEKELGKFSFFT